MVTINELVDPRLSDRRQDARTSAMCLGPTGVGTQFGQHAYRREARLVAHATAQDRAFEKTYAWIEQQVRQHSL